MQMKPYAKGRGGFVNSALVSRSSGLRSSPSRDHCVVLRVRHFTLLLLLSTQVYKRVPPNLIVGVTLGWTSLPYS